MTNIAQNSLYTLCFCAIILALNGCEDKESIGISNGKKMTQSDIEKAYSLADHNDLEDVFLNNSTITTYRANDNKNVPVVLIFGKNKCPYCDKLKEDIKASKAIKDTLTLHFNTYYINTSYHKEHTLTFKDETISTYKLLEMYVKTPMRPTPTMVFINTDGNVIYELPGYLPPKQILAIITYIDSKKWLNLNAEAIKNEINHLVSNL